MSGYLLLFIFVFGFLLEIISTSYSYHGIGFDISPNFNLTRRNDDERRMNRKLIEMKESKQRNILKKEFIHIGLTIDPYSIKDAMILINSILLSAINTEMIYFHLVTGEKTIELAEQLKNDLDLLMKQCYFSSFKFSYEIKPFLLPETSGFKSQLLQKLVAKNTKNHWNSPIGTDMMRFYLPSLFPTIPKILYLDNDIIVTCCIEEIYFTSLETAVIGIALDDLHWATITQFKRHYNASHPLIVKHMRDRKKGTRSLVGDAIQDEEFFKSVPRYPNDGVILFNISAYQSYHILEDMNEIASINSYDYVVNIGTQQFTVLALHDRWIELTPRANLRHFPNMARGYLMWFYYNGFIHYAGMFKPKGLCGFDSFKENHLRVMTYSAFLFSNYYLHEQCFQLNIPTWSLSLASSPTSSEQTTSSSSSSLTISSMSKFSYDNYFHTNCLNAFSHNHLIESLSLYEFMILLRTILTRFNDESYVYLYIGADTRPMKMIQHSMLQRQKQMQEQHAQANGSPPSSSSPDNNNGVNGGGGSLNSIRQWDYQEYRHLVDTKYQFPSITTLQNLTNYSFLKTFQDYLQTNPIGKDHFYEELRTTCSPSSSFSLIQLIHQMVLFDSNWSFRVFHSYYSQLINRFHHRPVGGGGPSGMGSSRGTTTGGPSERRSARRRRNLQQQTQQHESGGGGGGSGGHWQHVLKTYDPNRFIKDEYQWIYHSLQTLPKSSKFYQNILFRDNFNAFHTYHPQMVYQDNFDYETGKKKKKTAILPSTQERSFFIQTMKFCYKPNYDYYLQYANLSLLQDISFHNPSTLTLLPASSPSSSSSSSSSSSPLSAVMKITNEGCHDALQELKWEGKRHWDVMGLVMNVMSLEEMEFILNGLDLIFMRPKFIFLEFRFLSSAAATAVNGKEELQYFERLLKRIMNYMKKIGYLANHNYPLDGIIGNRKNGKERIQCSRKDGKLINFVHLWAIRMNLLEL